MEEKIKKQEKWKEFEECLKPIIKHCKQCEEYGICKFHEDWYYEVKEKFEQIK